MPSLFEAITFSDVFGTLGPEFSTLQNPTALPDPYLIAVSPSSLKLCGISTQQAHSPEFVQLFTGNQLAAQCQPRAAVYSGHQFGQWAGQLGDGRAIMLGELAGYEIQLKGSGLTPFSRMGDGRAVLRSSIREFLCSEAMVGLGIPTTRALCLTGSPMMVMREQPETSAVVTRIAASFIRFGSFEHWYYRSELDSLKTLADFVIQRYYPEFSDHPSPYQALLAEVTKRTAHLIAHWQTVGFMHGVLNTDNMSILGLTLDYGPFGFMEGFDSRRVCNHSDNLGRYSYAMQPQIGLWNCNALGQAMLPLIRSVEDTKSALADYQKHYQSKLSELWHAKLGLATQFDEDDELIKSMLTMMEANHLDFTIFFRRLSDLKMNEDSNDHTISDLCMDREAFFKWLKHYRARLIKESSIDAKRQVAMKLSNPKYVLRNYLAQQAIDSAQLNDFSEIEKLQQILSHPYDEQTEHDSYAALPPDWASELSVSCSS
ncbi:uncharacterized protein YdiU (UPF0061 family) [Oxalobacteraceae bacterium GrIS 2.11]